MASEKEVYDALTGAGFDMAQASGIMGNIQNESSYNQEAAALDSNGYYSYGLVQWNAASYPQASSYVTNNLARDLARQVQAITQAARNVSMGGTAADVAGAWASQFERCVGCQPGGAQYIARQQNADRIFQQARSGHWPSGPGQQGGGGGGVGSGLAAGTSQPGLVQELAPIWGLPLAIWESTGSQVTGIVTATEDVAQAVAGISNAIGQFYDWISWWFVPSHIVRVLAFLAGVPLVGFGIFNLSRTGKSYSVQAPVVGSVPAYGGSLAPVVGIAEIMVGSVLLFIAFHNLPATVIDLPSLLTYIQENVARPKGPQVQPV